MPAGLPGLILAWIMLGLMPIRRADAEAGTKTDTTFS